MVTSEPWEVSKPQSKECRDQMGTSMAGDFPRKNRAKVLLWADVTA